MGFRFFTLSIIFSLLFSALIIKLYNLQIEKSSFYIEQIRARSAYLEKLRTVRGEIFFTDRNQNVNAVASSKNYPIVYAVPKEIENAYAASLLLAGILNKDADKLRTYLAQKDSLFYRLKEKISPEEAKAIKELDLKGVYLDERRFRYYPFKELGANVIGFVGLNKEVSEPSGLYGVELYNDDLLRSGKDVYLTIDRSVQAEAEHMLDKLIEKFEAAGGTVIVEEPQTGRIVALANRPSFDPNEYFKFPVSNFANPAIQHVYEPGSVFKPLTMAIGIDLGVITPETTYTDKGYVTLNGRTIRNWDYKAYGKVTMTNVIEHSINTGAVYAVTQIGRDNFVKYMKAFGFTEKTGIKLPSEASGNLGDLTRSGFKEIDLATAAFGQGVAVTPLELVNAYSAIANGGVLMRPIINADDKPEIIRRVIKKSTAEKVIKMMQSAVSKAKVAAIKNYTIAGKTGTAQVPDFKKGGYSDKYIHTFVGLIPASSPRYVALIKLDKPNEELAGLTVVPAFKNFALFLISYYSIPPDDLTVD